MSAGPAGRRHLAELQAALDEFAPTIDVLAGWAARLAAVYGAGGRLLVVGNGGSAAQAQHLTAELVGRYRDERRPLSAIALHAETSSLTAIGNDYGPDEVFARQVAAHGRRGDVLLLLSTSGASTNILAAAAAGRRLGLQTWAMTGPLPNPLAAACGECLPVAASCTATVQEVHLVAIHLLCAALDAALGVSTRDAYDQSRHGDRSAVE